MLCRACGGTRLDPVFEMAPMPLAGAYARTRAEALSAERYPLTWLFCRRCGLVNVEPDIPDETLYATYRYAASQVPALVRHHADYAAFLKSQHAGKVRLLEIGSNDGVLLRQLPTDWSVLGIDPSDVESGYPTIREPFSLALAKQIGKYDVITSSNALAHFTGIEDAIEGVAWCLKSDGTAYIEVHDLWATLETAQWDTIYHEHKVEWSVDSLFIAFARHGLRLVDVHLLPLHGGLIRAVFQKGKEYVPRKPLRPFFTGIMTAYQSRNEDKSDLPPGAVAYGAAARASVYLNQVDVDLRYVVDGSPRRQGWFIPGTGHEIVTPERFEADDPPAALITAWNHAADIKARHPGYDRWVTAW